MAVNECIPLFEPGAAISAKAEAAVTGKRCVQISDPAEAGFGNELAATALGGNIVVSHGTVKEKPLGVASYDAGIGERLYVITGGVVPITNTGGVTAGDEVEVAANGQVQTLTDGVAIGVALDSASTGEDCFVKLY